VFSKFHEQARTVRKLMRMDDLRSAIDMSTAAVKIQTGSARVIKRNCFRDGSIISGRLLALVSKGKLEEILIQTQKAHSEEWAFLMLMPAIT
jgi:hypothetical protein